MVRWKGLEPPTHCLEGSCSIQLSYQRISNCLIMIPQEQDIVKHFFTNFSLWVYATQIYEPMLPIISLVGIQFIVSGYMVTSKIKNYSEELSKENITNFKGQTAKLTRYYTVKAIIFIIPLLTRFWIFYSQKSVWLQIKCAFLPQWAHIWLLCL